MQKVVAHSVCGVIEEVGYLLLGLGVHRSEDLVEQFNIVSAAGFEDLLLGRSALRNNSQPGPSAEDYTELTSTSAISAETRG